MLLIRLYFFYVRYLRTFDWVGDFDVFFYLKASASPVVPFFWSISDNSGTDFKIIKSFLNYFYLTKSKYVLLYVK